ncbi:MAG: transcriptional regulator [Bacteroidales bacterium]|nr:transcriptional regulator [Bacteroidales bacterium]
MKMLHNNSTLTIDEIAARLDVASRTIYRYIDTFKESGFTVINVTGNIYSLVEIPQPSPEFDNLVYFSDEESYLVNNLIDALSPTNALKAGLRKKLAVIYDSTGIEGFLDRRSNAAHVANLRKAAQEKKMVILHNYESANSNVVRDRLVEPFGFTNDFIEVWAYDTESKRNKLFKVQRIGEVEITEQSWKYETSHRKQGRDIFRMTGYANSRVRMRLSVRAKNLIIEEYPLAEKAITRDGNYWLLDTIVNDFAGICRYYVGLIPEIKVLEGAEFLEYVRAYMKKYINKV